MARRSALVVWLAGALTALGVAVAPPAGAVTVAWDVLYPNAEIPQGGSVDSATSVGDVRYLLFDDDNTCWVARLDTDGSTAWIRDVGHAREMRCSGIASDAGALYVTMSAWGPLDGMPHGDKADSYVRKLDLEAGVLWTRAYSGTDSQVVWDIAVGGGSVYVVGAIYHPLGVSEAFVRRYDSDGDLRWTRIHDSELDDLFISVAADADGVYVGRIDFQDSSDVRRYRSDGSLAWVSPLSAEGGTEILGMVRSGGSLYVAGATGGVFDGKESLGWYDAWVASFDATSGALTWLRQFGSDSSDLANAIAVGPGGVYVAGQLGGSLPRFENRGSLDAFVRAYTFDGKRRWTRQFGTHREDLATAVLADAGGVVVIGETLGNFGDGRSNGGRMVFARRWVPA
jgi:hypothetical protein